MPQRMSCIFAKLPIGLRGASSSSDARPGRCRIARHWRILRSTMQIRHAPGSVCGGSRNCNRTRGSAPGRWQCGGEGAARERDLPRSWILSDTAMFEAAHTNPGTPQALRQALHLAEDYPAALVEGLLGTLRSASAQDPQDLAPSRDARPTAE